MTSLFAQEVIAISPLERKQGFNKHNREKELYEKKRVEDFKKYKADHHFYQQLQKKARNKQLKKLKIIRNSKKEEKKVAFLENRWNRKQKKMDKRRLEWERKYIQKRSIQRSQEKKFSVKDGFIF